VYAAPPLYPAASKYYQPGHQAHEKLIKSGVHQPPNHFTRNKKTRTKQQAEYKQEQQTLVSEPQIAYEGRRQPEELSNSNETPASDDIMRETNASTEQLASFTEEERKQFYEFEIAYRADQLRDVAIAGTMHHDALRFCFGSNLVHDLTGYDSDIVRMFRILKQAGELKWLSDNSHESGINIISINMIITNNYKNRMC